MSLPAIFLVVLIVFGAAVLRGFGGFGFAMFSVPMLASVLPPRDAVVLSIELQVVVGLLDVRRSVELARWSQLRPLFLGALIATPIGYLGLSVMTPRLARIVLAAAAVVASVVLFVPKAQRLENRFTPLFVGVAAGLMNGLAAMPGPPILAYFMSGETPLEARASMIVFFLAVALVGAANVAVVGGYSELIFVLGVASIPSLLIGNHLGKILFLRASPLMFKRTVIGGLLIATTTALIKSVT